MRTGLATRFGWVPLPPQFQVFDNDLVIGAAVVVYLIEFFADKIPIVDTIWDLVHTVIRPAGGALIAVATLGEASPTSKTSTRAVANTSPEPVTNWALSFGEDLFVVGLGYLALQYPVAALVVSVVLLALIVVFAAVIIRTVRRWFARLSTG